MGHGKQICLPFEIRISSIKSSFNNLKSIKMKQSKGITIRVSPEAKAKYQLHSERLKKGISKMIKDMLDMDIEKKQYSTDIEVLRSE